MVVDMQCIVDFLHRVVIFAGTSQSPTQSACNLPGGDSGLVDPIHLQASLHGVQQNP
jgi:hypothetical protein